MLEYAAPIWSESPQYFVDEIEGIQNRRLSLGDWKENSGVSFEAKLKVAIVCTASEIHHLKNLGILPIYPYCEKDKKLRTDCNTRTIVQAMFITH